MTKYVLVVASILLNVTCSDAKSQSVDFNYITGICMYVPLDAKAMYLSKPFVKFVGDKQYYQTSPEDADFADFLSKRYMINRSTIKLNDICKYRVGKVPLGEFSDYINRYEVANFLLVPGRVVVETGWFPTK